MSPRPGKSPQLSLLGSLLRSEVGTALREGPSTSWISVEPRNCSEPHDNGPSDWGSRDKASCFPGRQLTLPLGILPWPVEGPNITPFLR